MSLPFARTTRSLAADAPRAAWLWWSLAGLLLAVWTAWFCLAKVGVFVTSAEARLEVEQTAYPIGAPVSGKVIRSALALGQEIEAGQLLAELDSTRQRLQLDEEEAALAALPEQIAALHREIEAQNAAGTGERSAADSALETARARLREAETAAAFAQDQARRIEELRAHHSIPEVEALKANAEAGKLAAAREALAADVHRLERERQTRGHEKRATLEDRKRQAALLSGRLEATRASVARLRQDIEQRLIRAPAAGRLGDLRPLQAGAYVSEGEKLATLIPAGSLRIVASFPPAEVLGRIRPGQKARMRLDGFPWAQFGTISAKVRQVGSEIRDNRVRVEFAPDPAASRALPMQHGLPGSIEVDIEQATPAVLVLRAAGQKLAGSTEAREPRATAGNPS